MKIYCRSNDDFMAFFPCVTFSAVDLEGQKEEERVIRIPAIVVSGDLWPSTFSLFSGVKLRCGKV